MNVRTSGTLVLMSLLGAVAGTSWAQNDAPHSSPDFYCAVDGIPTRVDAPGVLANDVDADFDPLSALLGAAPATGTLTLGADGSFDYAPPFGFTGTVTFTYRASDGGAASLPTAVEISVGRRVGCTDESNYLSTISNLGHLVIQEGFESDAEWSVSRFPNAAGSVTSRGVTWAANRSAGKLSTGMGAALNGLWGVFANPHGNTTGVLTAPERDGFIVARPELLYGAGGWFFSNTAGAQIAAELDETVLIDFRDPILSSLHRFFGVIDASGFSRLEFFETEGTVEDQKYVFADDFTFASSSPSGNRRPSAAEDLYSATAGSALHVDAPGVLFNDTDADSDPLTSVLASSPQFGIVTLSSDGSFDYSPGPGFSGDDSFTYVANDGFVDSNPATVRISVAGGNQPPIADADAFPLEEGGTLSVPAPGVLDNDFDPDFDALTAAVVTPPSFGALALASDGSFTYVHDGSENFSDEFTYTASDGLSLSAPATVLLSIASVNDGIPVANGDGYGVTEGGTLALGTPGVLVNDTDADGDPLAAAVASPPAHGTLSLAPDGSFTYVHDGSENLSDGFTYTATDGVHVSAPATVSITILPTTPEAPLAFDDRYSVERGGTLDTRLSGEVSVLANDVDLNGDPLSARLWEPPVRATFFQLNADGSFTYTHDGADGIEDAFTYVASDGAFDSTPARVILAIRFENRAPLALAGRNRRGRVGAVVTLDGSNSFDPDGDPITYRWRFRSVPNGRTRQSALTDASIAGRDTPLPSFVPDVAGRYVLELVVNDGALDSAPSFTAVTAVTALGRVSRPRLQAPRARSGQGSAPRSEHRELASEGNVPPEAYAGLDATVLIGDAVVVDGGESRDSDHGPQPLRRRWSLRSRPLGSKFADRELIGSRTAHAQFVPDVAGVYTLRLEIDDGNASDTDEVVVRASTPTSGTAPNARAGSDVHSPPGAYARVDGSASFDSDGLPEPLLYRWSVVSTPRGSRLRTKDLLDARSAAPLFFPDTTGAYVLRVEVSDGTSRDFDNVVVFVR